MVRLGGSGTSLIRGLARASKEVRIPVDPTVVAPGLQHRPSARAGWSFLGVLLGLGAAGLGGVSLVGAWMGRPWLGVPSIGGAPMAPVTSLLMIVAGLSVVLASVRAAGWSRVLGALAALAAAAVLVEYFFDVDLRMDRLGGASPAESGHPGRPSVYTALAIACLGLSLIVLREYGVVRRRVAWLSPLLASLAVAIGVIAGLGYADSLRLPRGGGPNIAPFAALAILAGGAGVLAVTARRSRAVLESDGAPGAWVPAWIGGPVAALVFSGTLAAWVVIMHLGPSEAAGGALEIGRASLAIVAIAAALGLVSGAAAALLARSRFQVRRTKMWADSLATTQVRLRALFQQAAVGIELLSPEGRMLEVNDKLCEILGITRQVLLGKNFREITLAEDLPGEERLLARLLDRQIPSYAVEKRYLDAEGRAVWVRVTSSLAVDRQGRAMYRISIVEDISLRKRAEEALRDSESRKSAMLEGALDAVISMDGDGRIIEFNPAAEEMFGWDRAQALGRRAEDLIVPERLRGSGGLENLARAAEGGGRVEVPALRADGTEFPAEISVSATDPAEGVNALTAFVRDITERLRSEAAAAQLAAIVASSDDAIMSIDLSGTIRTFNRGAERLYGYKAAELLGKPVAVLIPQERRAEEEQILQRIRRGEPVEHHETQRLTKDGRLIGVSLTVSPIRDVSDRVVGASKIARDIGERMRAEAARAQLAAIVASSEDAIISKDLNGVITTFNAGAERLFGYAAGEVIGKSVTILIPPERLSEEDMILSKIRRGEPVHHYETVRVKKNGERLAISLTVSPMRDSTGRIVGASKVARDITQRKRVEEELNSYREDLERQVQMRTAELERSQDRLRSSERLAALGTLSAGLGHDMGNLLLPVRMRLEALEREPLPDHVRDDLKAIAASAVYLQRLATSLRLFAVDPSEDGGEGSRITAEGAELNQWWRDTEPLLRAALPRGVFLDVTPGPDARSDAGPFPTVRVAVSPPRLMQAVFNLVQNAAEAIHDSGKRPGWVRISGALGEGGGEVRLSVEDNGPGMSPDVLRRCMEPFFSTKTRRISTGMGLSMVRGYIEQAGGRVEVSSQVGTGTRFVLVLPTLSDSPRSGVAERVRCRAAVTMRDPRARALVEWSLRSLGAEVKPAETAAPPREEADVWVVDPRAASASEIEEFTRDNDGRRLAVVCGREPPAGESRTSESRVLYTGESASPAAIRKTLEQAVAAACRE